jgi:hypothetical protein
MWQFMQLKECRNVVRVTIIPAQAEYTLNINPGSSGLFDAKGNAVYVSKAKVKLSNVAKDVCNYLSAQ